MAAKWTTPVSREMRGMDGKTYIVTLYDGAVDVREKRTRSDYPPCPITLIHQRQAEMQARQVKIERDGPIKPKRKVTRGFLG